jgi:hypothetical protein
MLSSLPGQYSHAERVAWRASTSDVIGSHTKQDVDGYLSSVRRKIQEKFANVQDLILGWFFHQSSLLQCRN